MRITTVITISTVVLTITAQTKPIQSDDIPPQTQSAKDEASQILFGERGILTGIFRMMDQQRKVQTAPQHDIASADNSKIGNFDFKKIVDTLVSGSSGKGELGDHATELPEVLGICNRLSCGDIYKAIDKFRKSEMFSNFQTALTLVNDPNGWETIGKLLSNPELIAQFTAGSGMEELFGSALGTAEKESKLNKNKNSKIMPEDGDFGIDFSEDGEGENITKTIDPKIDFSVDKKGESEDYYSEVANVGDESEEEVIVDQTLPPSTKITKSAAGTTDFNEKLPPVSFSIDGGGEENENEETETVITAELPPKPPRVLKRIHAGGSTDTKDGVQPASVTKITWLTTTSPATTYSTSTTTFFRPVQTTRPVVTTTWRTTTRRITTTTKPTTTTTLRNYRKDNDYYSMYYDDADKG